MIQNLKRYPLYTLLVGFFIYLGYGFVEFHFLESGESKLHQTRIASMQADLTAQQAKLDEAKRFMEALELKRKELQAQVKQLEEFQVVLSENLDIPALIKQMVTETKRSGLRLDRIEPGKKSAKEFYLEQEFKLNIRGTYPQLVLFFLNLSKLKRILRVESFTLKPQATTANAIVGRSVGLNAQLSVRAYQYVVSKEDRIGSTEVRK